MPMGADQATAFDHAKFESEMREADTAVAAAAPENGRTSAHVAIAEQVNGVVGRITSETVEELRRLRKRIDETIALIEAHDSETKDANTRHARLGQAAFDTARIIADAVDKLAVDFPAGRMKVLA